MRIIKWAIPYIILWAGILFALGINKNCIRDVNPSNTLRSSFSLTSGGTIWSVDNLSYQKQFSNWMDHNSFSIEVQHPEYKVRRTPVYPLFIGIPLYYLGEKIGFTLIYILQFMLHLLAAYFFGQIVLYLSNSRRLRLIGFYLYGLCPFIFIYVNYTITESLTPFLVTSVLYCFIMYCHSERKARWLILTGVVLGLATLHRPLLIFYALPLGLYVCFADGLTSNIRRKLTHSAVFATAFALTMAPWMIRNYIITKEIIITEKWYYEDPMYYGRSHTYLRTWINSFTNPANNLSAEVFVERLRNSQGSLAANVIVQDYLSRIPAWVFTINKREEVEKVLTDYAWCQQNRVTLSDSFPDLGLKALGTRTCEYECKEQFSAFTAAIKKSSPLKYYVMVPMKVLFRDGIVHSFSSAWAMLNASCLNKWVVMAIKAAFLLFNVALWMSVFVFLLRKKKPFDRKIGLTFIVAIITFIAFHLFIFRYVESRYFLPFYPILLLFFVCNLNIIRFRRKALPGG